MQIRFYFHDFLLLLLLRRRRRRRRRHHHYYYCYYHLKVDINWRKLVDTFGTIFGETLSGVFGARN